MPRPRMTALLAIGLGASILLTSCTTAPPDSSAPPASTPAATAQGIPTGTPQVVTTGLNAPWSVVFLDGTPLISERDSARILELSGDGTTREIGTLADVEHAGEGGLLA